MPVLKNAKKKLKQDKKRTMQNRAVKEKYRKLIKAVKAEKSEKSLSAAFSSVDKAAKQNIIHKNKASRIKSSLSKLISTSSKSA